MGDTCCHNAATIHEVQGRSTRVASRTAQHLDDMAEPSPGGGVNPVKVGLGVGLLVLLNIAFNELMDDSGLHVTMLTARLPAGTNATGRAVFRAGAELAGMTLEDASEVGVQRFELVEGADAADAPFMVALISRQQLETAALPSWLASELGPVELTQRMTTIFPERARWKITAPHIEPGELGEIGRVGLLVQQVTWSLGSAETAEAFRRNWPDLGYNALGETGVVRCDLLLVDPPSGGDGAAGPTRFVTRKVFRDSTALRAHEKSEHFERWKASIDAEANGKANALSITESRTYHTLLPRTSAYPFRSRWSTSA